MNKDIVLVYSYCREIGVSRIHKKKNMKKKIIIIFYLLIFVNINGTM